MLCEKGSSEGLSTKRRDGRDFSFNFQEAKYSKENSPPTLLQGLCFPICAAWEMQRSDLASLGVQLVVLSHKPGGEPGESPVSSDVEASNGNAVCNAK